MDLELFIVLFSVPLFLIVVLLITVIVLANYSGTEPAKASPAKGKASEVNKDAKNVGS